MGTARQDRGKRTNVVVAAWLRARGWGRARPTVGAERGQDVQDVFGHSIEVKARSDFDPRTWLRQARANAADGEVPCCIVRCNGQGEQPENYLVFRLLSDDVLARGPLRTERLGTWYRSLKDGTLWCESSDPDEVRRAGGDTFQKLESWKVTEAWKDWDYGEG